MTGPDPGLVQHPAAPRGLGRRRAPDHRDYMAGSVLKAIPTVPYRYWNAGSWWGDQGDLPHCVGYSGVAWLEDGPVTFDGPTPDPARFYDVCQANDEWEGNDYDGTSVRALARVLRDVNLCREAGIQTAEPLIDSYYFAESAIEVAKAILTTGPVVMGTDWYWDWFDPGPTGYLAWDGDVIARRSAGGHAWKADGCRIYGLSTVQPDMADPKTWDLRRSFIRGKQSWGRAWGASGFFYMRLETVQALLMAYGEAMLAIEADRFRPG